jgi:class 3 adenylate cyclase
MIILYALPQRAPERFETRSNDIVLGRSPANENRLDLDLKADLYVSHAHARVTCEENGYWIEDLGSINGTWVDGEMISEKTLLGPDTDVKVGWTRIQVHMERMSRKPGLMPGDENAISAQSETGNEAHADDMATIIGDVSFAENGPVDIEAELERPGDGVDADLAATVVGPTAVPADGRSEHLNIEAELEALNRDAELEFQDERSGAGGADLAATVVGGAALPGAGLPEHIDIEAELDALNEKGGRVDADLAATVVGGAAVPAAGRSEHLDIGSELDVLDERPGAGDADLAATVVGGLEPAAAGKPDDADSLDITGTVGSVAPTIATASPSPPVAAPEEDDTRGNIICITDATANRFPGRETVTAEDILTLAWRQLKAFNELGATLDAALSLNELVNILATRMPGVIPNALRGAVLMPDDRGGLLLKAHWPAGEHSVSMTWVHRAFEMREAFIWAMPEDRDGGPDMPRSAAYYQVQSAIYTPLMIGEKVFGVMYVDNYLTRDAFSATDFELLKAIANHVALFIRDRLLQQERLQEKELQAHLQRQFSPAIAARIASRAERLQLGGERVDPVTILVSDVRNFTAMSAKMPPHEVVRMLNEMFDAFVPIIFEFGGVVDKYVGDSVLAVFGSPEPDDRQWEKALRAAMEMQQAVRMLGEGRRVRRLPIFDVGISLNSGEAIHGFIGSGQRIEYTVIGDTVNRASRLCDGAAPGEVIISQSVYERVYRIADVRPKTVRTKHSDTEPDLQAYVVTRLQ